jgi:cobalt-zinc-cadmium efflux system membrane fusion protein
MEAKAQQLYLKAEFERQKMMLEENITSMKKFLKAESAYKTVVASYTGLHKQLSMLNIPLEQVEEGTFSSTAVLYTPISGSITKVAISQGAYVAPETLIVEIVDNKSVHLELAVFEKDIMRVKKGQKLKFNIPEALPDTLAGSVHLVGTSLESNRTVRVHGDIENENYIFLTGMFVEADIITETAMAFAVPSRAVVETDSNLYVLVLEKEKNGIYHFSQKEVFADAQYNGYSALKNAQEFNPQTQFLIKGAFKLLGE